MIERNTRWIEVTELEDINATTAVAAFFKFWIPRYGVTVTVITDRCTQFTQDDLPWLPFTPNLLKCWRDRSLHKRSSSEPGRK